MTKENYKILLKTAQQLNIKTVAQLAHFIKERNGHLHTHAMQQMPIQS